MKNISFTIVLLLASIFITSCGQSRHEKVLAIIEKFQMVESQRMNFEFNLQTVKDMATGSDSLRIVELEQQMSEEEILKRIISAMDEIFSDNEIDDIYNYIQSTACDKLFNYDATYKVIASKFSDINEEIEQIIDDFSNSLVEEPTNKFEPIPIDRENGFYATVNYYNSILNENIQLEEKPSLTFEDIQKVKKGFSDYNNRAEIDIEFTKEGAQKFYLLTKENIDKPLAIVMKKRIVSMPMVYSEIMGGKSSITGNFTEKEIDEMIEELIK